MTLSISYKDVESHDDLHAETQRCQEKLARLLKSYAPDLVKVHGVFSKNTRNEEYSFSLNLSLPTGSLHATGVGKNARASCKQAFSELQTQLKKHQALLRKDFEWKRKRPHPSLAQVL